MPTTKSKPPRFTQNETEYRKRVPKRRITIQILGSAEDGGAPSLSDFLKQLEAIKVALKHTERLLSGGRDVYFRIVDLSMRSPATVVLEETPVMTEEGKRGFLPKVSISEKLVSTLRQINQRGSVPAKVKDLPALEAYRNVGTALVKHSGEVTIPARPKLYLLVQRSIRRLTRSLVQTS